MASLEAGGARIAEMVMGVGRLVSGAAVAALLVTGSVPVQAAAPFGPAGWNQGNSQDYGGRRYRHRRHHRGDGIDTGDVIAGVAVVGVLAAILSAKSRDDRDRRARDQAPPSPSRADNSEPGYTPDRSGDARADAGGPAGANGIISGEAAAVDACAVAAEQEAARIGQNPSVRDIETVDGSGREWRIAGTVETRDGYRSTPATHRFDCSVRYGQIERVDVDEGTLASR